MFRGRRVDWRQEIYCSRKVTDRNISCCLDHGSSQEDHGKLTAASKCQKYFIIYRSRQFDGRVEWSARASSRPEFYPSPDHARECREILLGAKRV